MSIHPFRFIPGAPARSRRRQAGVGLVEALVALVIASFALLGFAGLQMASLRYQKVAQFRSLASQYSADIADRMRANLVGSRAGNYVSDTGDYGSNTEPGKTDCATGCSAADVAALDIFRWRQALARMLAGGWGEISGNVTDGFTVTVYFKEPNKPAAATDALDPNCRAAALGDADKDVRCFRTVFLP